MTDFQPERIIRYLRINYLLFLLAFLVLGLAGSAGKSVLWANFVIDVLLCVSGTFLLSRLWMSSSSLAGKIGWSLLSAFCIFFTWFAFLAPEAGLPPVLFA